MSGCTRRLTGYPLRKKSIEIRNRSPRLFDLAPLLLALYPPFPRGTRWFRFLSRLRPLHYPLNESNKPFNRSLSVPLLGPMLSRFDDQYSVPRDAPAGHADEPRADIAGQRRGVSHIEPQLDRSRDLVHILAARARGPYKEELDFLLIER
jgi:hypothetical protein